MLEEMQRAKLLVRFTQNRLMIVGGVILALLVLAALTAPLLVAAKRLPAPLDAVANGLDADGMPQAPGREFLAGTDDLGRNVFSRVLFASRVSLSISAAAMLIATIVGVTIGVTAGYHGGVLDVLFVRLTEMNMAFPAILLSVAYAGVMDGRIVHLHPHWITWPLLDVSLKRGVVSLSIIIGLVCWPSMVRLVRAKVLEVKNSDFLTAARVLGGTDTHLIFRHVLPNVLPTVAVAAVMAAANAVLLEAGMDYLGIGVPPPAPTWGSMINSGQPYFVSAPHLVFVPGAAIVLMVLALNFLAQGIQNVCGSGQIR